MKNSFENIKDYADKLLYTLVLYLNDIQEEYDACLWSVARCCCSEDGLQVLIWPEVTLLFSDLCSWH